MAGISQRLPVRLAVVGGALASVAAAAGLVSAPGSTPGERRAQAHATLAAYLGHVQRGDEAGARALSCAGAIGAFGHRPGFVAFSIGEPRPGVVGGMLAFPVQLGYADGESAAPWVAVAFGPGGPQVCGALWRR
jgi:hypothetical protein